MPSLPDMTTPNVAELARDAAAHANHPTVPAPDAGQEAFLEFLLRTGDTTLILGHRVSEWCGHSPALEEDIALANVALDLIGQTRMWLGLAAEVEGKGRTADDLAYLRDVWDFRNLLLVERPNGDFGHTLMRQFLFDAYHHELLEALQGSSDPRVAEIAAKAAKEVAYHLERSSDLVVRLGDGSDESHRRMRAALDALWPYVGEMFVADEKDATVAAAGIAPDPASLKPAWEATVRDVLTEATLTIPGSDFAHKGGKRGIHTEHLGHILADLQFLQRAYPGSTW
jgi:ring-1,2-phenylacetyl-CoA epoxidase subunit PaaC